METENRLVSAEEIEQLADHFDVSTSWLSGENEGSRLDAAKLQLTA